MHLDRSRIAKVALAALLVLGFWAVLPGAAHAVQLDDAATPYYPDIQFILSTFSFLVWGALVMWMCAGFTMLEAGSVRTKNASMICLKNVGIFSIAGLAYFFVGYNLMYVDRRRPRWHVPVPSWPVGSGVDAVRRGGGPH